MSALGTAGHADGAVAVHHGSSIHLQQTLGTLSWNDAVAHARAAGRGARLPTHAEVRKHIANHGKQPLFDKDMWWPVSDAPNAWVSVGNYDPSVRLGNRHDALFGPPGWGTTTQFADFRTSMGIMVPAAFALTVTDASGTMTWAEAASHAKVAGNGARLPTHAEVRAYIADHGHGPLFDKDVWWPVSDAPSAWVSVGNYDTHVRLGNRHDALFGPPGWGRTNQFADFRTSIGIMRQSDGHRPSTVGGDAADFIEPGTPGQPEPEAVPASAASAASAAHLPAVIAAPAAAELPDTSDPAQWRFIDGDGDTRGPLTVTSVMAALVLGQITPASLVFNPGWASDPRTAHLTWMPMKEAPGVKPSQVGGAYRATAANAEVSKHLPASMLGLK